MFSSSYKTLILAYQNRNFSLAIMTFFDFVHEIFCWWMPFYFPKTRRGFREALAVMWAFEREREKSPCETLFLRITISSSMFSSSFITRHRSCFMWMYVCVCFIAHILRMQSFSRGQKESGQRLVVNSHFSIRLCAMLELTREGEDAINEKTFKIYN